MTNIQEEPTIATGYTHEELREAVRNTAYQEQTRHIVEVLNTLYPAETWDDGVESTAWRIFQMWGEYMPRNMDFKPTVFEANVNQLIVVNNIEFSSLCAHHLLPFFGIAHVGYIPNRLMIGLSKIPRIVDHFATRPQVQERLTAQVATYVKDLLAAHGVAVVMIARHTCMACRGVRKHNGHMTTSEMRGVFLTSSSARAEFMKMIDTSVTL
jgi:GTP cyclohydrolase I